MQGHVELDWENINNFKFEKHDEISKFFKPPSYLGSLSSFLAEEEVCKIIHAYNAINASLQYCFFLGSAKVRFDGIDSFEVMKMLDTVFKDHSIVKTSDIASLRSAIIKALINSNITLLETRISTIEEVFDKLDFVEYGNSYLDIERSVSLLKELVCFKRDLFFKKGLFAIMITSRMLPKLKENSQSYKEQLFSLPVPADYQIPKMLRHFNLIQMSPELISIIDSNEMLIENSEMELNIRAGTVQACNAIAKNNNISVDDVDAYLFMHRKDSSLMHHLCTTTNY